MIPALFLAATLAAAHVQTASTEPNAPARPPTATDGRQDAPAALREDPGLAADLAVLERLDRPFAEPKNFDGTIVREVLEQVQAATGLEAQADRLVLGDADSWTFERVHGVMQTPRQALDAVAATISSSTRPIHLEIVAGLPVFTDDSSAPRLAAVRPYDLRALIARRDNREMSVAEHAAEILALVESSVDPASWRSNDGEIGWIRPVDSTLVVCTTPVRHHAVRKLLAGIEASMPPSAVLWTVRVAEISPDVAEHDLALILDSGRELDTLVARKGATMASASKLLVARGESAQASIDQGAAAIRVALTPVEGSRSVMVEVKIAKGAESRSLTLRAVEGTRVAGLLEAGPAEAAVADPAKAPRQRLLVEVVATGATEKAVAEDRPRGVTGVDSRAPDEARP